MSKAHLFHSAEGLVVKSLRGLISYNPSLSLDETNRVVVDTTHDPSQVSLISGGGSGHEPAWSGYVGTNMLAASVGGDIFASPSTTQILAAIDAAPSTEGTILVVTNYTGDCLHFGLANEKAAARGHRCRMIICGDDVSVGRTGGVLVGRRGLAGQIGVLKIMGGAAGQGAALDDVYDLGVAFSAQIVSIAATLDHCHVPGRTEHATLGDDEVELGTGPHNEPGYKKLSPAPSAEELVAQILTHCLDENDPERGYVQFRPGDETMLLISNFGGMSQLELGALTDEILEQLAANWNIEPVRVYAGPLETSLNAPAFSVSIVNITAAAKNCRYSAEQIKAFADVKTTTFWESLAGAQGGGGRPRRARPHHQQQQQQLVKPPRPTVATPTTKAVAVAVDPTKDLAVDPAVLNAMLRSACAALIAAEPDLTKWDTVLGDGDCGETLKTGAVSLLAALDDNNTRGGLAGAGSVVAVLHALEDIVETQMGGTLGGILGIFFVALRRGVEQYATTGDGDDDSDGGAVPPPSPPPEKTAHAVVWGRALAAALAQLGRYTPAAVGDRTVMDTLIPFAEVLHATGSWEAAVAAAVRGAEGTRAMTPRLGRATYVAAGRRENGASSGGLLLPPDPGAWGVIYMSSSCHLVSIPNRAEELSPTVTYTSRKLVKIGRCQRGDCKGCGRGRGHDC